MNVLLTGATGFIGSHLHKALSLKHHISAITRSRCRDGQDPVSWIAADLAEANFIALLPEKVDAVVFLAQAREYREFPDQLWPIFNVNIRALTALLDYARRCGAKKFIFTSSANVYRRSSQLLHEDSPIAPTSFYAHSKRFGEMLMQVYAQWFECVVLRLFTVYGSGQTQGLMAALIDQVRHQRPIKVEGQRGLCLSPIEVTDVCSVIRTILERHGTPGLEVFNVSGDEPINIHELGLKIGKVLGMMPRFEFLDVQEPEGWMGDSSKLKGTFQLPEFLPLLEGLKRMAYA
jgi:UDP-glucose 4-epimerase